MRGVSTRESQGALVKKVKAHARDLEKELDTRTRELADAREHLSEALEHQTATSEGYLQFAGRVGAGI
jgi:hypothetical protein